MLNQNPINHVFWELKTGRKIKRFDERIFGFSHDETRFFTYSPQTVTLYSYPEFTPACEFGNLGGDGPYKFVFSANDRFLAVLFATGRPESDEYYPYGAPVRRSVVKSRIFDLKECQEIREFSKLRPTKLGTFSRDSKFYDLDEAIIFTEEGYTNSSWRFDLITNKIQKVKP